MKCDALGLRRGDREGGARHVRATSHGGHGDSQHFAVEPQQRPAGRARSHGRAELHQLPTAQAGEVPHPNAREDSHVEARAGAVRPAAGHNEGTRSQLTRVAELEGLVSFAVDLDHREVRRTVDRLDLGRSLLAVGKRDPDLLCVFHDIGRGEDMAGLVDEEATAGLPSYGRCGAGGHRRLPGRVPSDSSLRQIQLARSNVELHAGLVLLESLRELLERVLVRVLIQLLRLFEGLLELLLCLLQIALLFLCLEGLIRTGHLLEKRGRSSGRVSTDGHQGRLCGFGDAPEGLLQRHHHRSVFRQRAAHARGKAKYHVQAGE